MNWELSIVFEFITAISVDKNTIYINKVLKF